MASVEAEIMMDAVVNNNNTENKDETNGTVPKHAADPSALELDAPKIFSIPNSEEYHKTTKFCNKDVYVRLSRFIFFSFLPMLFLFILTHFDEIDLSLLIGIAIEIMYIVYFSMISYLFYTGAKKSKDRYLFRIWTKSEPVPGWASMNIATHQQLYQFEAIQSISEFSAIDGGIPSFMLSNLGPFTWAVVTMHFASEIHCNSTIFHWDIADYLQIIGVCGLVMIGIFELDPYNPPMKFFHYVGAGAGVGTIAGMFIQQISLSKTKNNNAFLAIPIIISIVAGACFVLWQWSNKKTDQYQAQIRKQYKDSKPTDEALKEIKAQITSLSVRNVVFEGIFLWLGATSLAIWLMNYGQSCKIGCAGEY